MRPIKVGSAESALCSCSQCAAEITVTAQHGTNGKQHKGGARRPVLQNEGQAIKKIQAQGWSFVRSNIYCPKCEEKRKVVPIKKPDELRHPTRAQKREIMDLLETCYDTEQERYRQGDTDDTVAEVLKVMPGWVEQIREEFFGPDGGNENIEDLVLRLAEMERELKAAIQGIGQQRTKAEIKLAEVSTMRVELDRIKKAVGPRKVA